MNHHFSNIPREEINYLRDRDISYIESKDFAPPDGVSILEPKDVIRAHYMLAEFFYEQGNGLGGIGLKDEKLFVSAMCRQFAGYDGELKWKTIHEKAATLLFGLVMNHPFHDANKRTAYLSVVYFYYKSGYIFEASEKELEDMTVNIVEKKLNRYPRFLELQKKSSDPEIEYLAWWFRKNTRKADKKQYLVTYRELDNLLKKFDAWLENPRNNDIDVMRKEKVVVQKRGFLKKEIIEERPQKKYVLSFPGWNKQVGKDRINAVRKALNLTHAHGVDSRSFFSDADDMAALIGKYEGALRRLAYR